MLFDEQTHELVPDDKYEDNGDWHVEVTKYGVFRVRPDGRRFKVVSSTNPLEGINPVNPSHYETKSMRCKDIINVMVEGLTPREAVDMANIIKYLYRFKYKDGMKDLKKAAEYLTFLMEDTEIKGE